MCVCVFIYYMYNFIYIYIHIYMYIYMYIYIYKMMDMLVNWLNGRNSFIIWASGFPVVKNLPVSQETQVDPWVRKIPGEGNGNPLLHSCLDRGTWQATVHGVTKSWTQLSNKYILQHIFITYMCIKSSWSTLYLTILFVNCPSIKLKKF